MRFIHAVREFNQEHGTALRTIALYSEADRNAMFVCEADEAVFLNGAAFSGEDPYLDYGLLRRALATARADAAWPGWGLVAEQPAFAELCEELNLVFLGPDANVLRRVADKIAAKQLAERAGIAVVPWSDCAVETVFDAHKQAERLGYPVLVKPAAGSGAYGIRRVDTSAQLADAFECTRIDACRAYDDPAVYLEKVLNDVRQIEVPILADQHGATWALEVRDCTVQRGYQKVLQESPAPTIGLQQARAMREAALRFSRAAGFRGAGTVEFLYHPPTQGFYFLEMNPSLAAEHPLTERITGIDLVKLQIEIARGGKLPAEIPQSSGHAIEVHLEGHNSGLAPGTIERLRIAAGPGVRIDAAVSVGDHLPTGFHGTIAKVIAFGQSRKEALSRLQRVLRESVVVFKGGVTNKAFLLDLLDRPEVQTAQVDIGWFDRAQQNETPSTYADVALVQAGIEAYAASLAVEKAQFYASAVRGRPQVSSEVGRTVELRCRGQVYSFKIRCLAHRQYRVDVEGSSVDAHIHPLGPYEYWLTVFGRRFHIVSIAEGLNYQIEVDGTLHSIDRGDGGLVYAPGPSVVVSVAVKPGDQVESGQTLVVLEAMKLEMVVTAPFAGKVRQVMTIPHTQVDAGNALLQIEAASDTTLSDSCHRVKFSISAASTAEQPKTAPGWRAKLDAMRQFMLGFDVDAAQVAELRTQWEHFKEDEADGDEVRRGEDEMLNIFVDVCSLFRRRPSLHDLAGTEEPSTESYLFAYLRRPGSSSDDLPKWFLHDLQRTLRHYGVTNLERSDALQESLLWLYKSHQRLERQIPLVMCLLERRLARLDTVTLHPSNGLRNLLERVITVTQATFPGVSDLAREICYLCFEQPVFERARSLVYEQVENQLAYLAAHREAADRDQRIQALLECPQPLASLFSGRIAQADPVMRELMLEVVTARYYRGQTLHGFSTAPLDGHSCVTADYEENGAPVHVIATHSEYWQAADVLREVSQHVQQQTPVKRDIVLDLYLWNPSFTSDPELIQQELHAVLNQAKLPPELRRVVIAIAGPGRGPGLANMQHFTYMLSADRYMEEKFYRGIHPMMAERLHLWRLKNFDVERLPSVEDVYLMHAVAHENPKDERLFAVAEVRDLTAVRDESGGIVQLPSLERMFAEAVASMRLVQSRRAPKDRLFWNRILLYVWPTFDLKPEEISAIAHRLAPSTDGLGLEQVVILARMPDPQGGGPQEMVLRISAPGDAGLLITRDAGNKLQPLTALTSYDQKVVRMRRRGLTYPYEIIKMLTASGGTQSEFPPGEFTEYDLDAAQQLVPVQRPYGQNKVNIVAGVIRNFTRKYPEGMTRVLLLGDPSRDMGALAEPECRRIEEALNLAEKMEVPLEWFSLSAGAKISMDSGVENMDWISRVLRRLIEFTQAGGEVNLVVNGINVGAQPYWNAEATMLMHTRGILIMTPKAAMVLTGKRALDYSGSVSADDNEGIGGYDRIMGLNGQAQYWARDLDEGCRILFRHYEHTYRAPGERFPRRAATADPIERDIRSYPHGDGRDGGFVTVGEIFSAETNAGRKRPFEIRKVMMAVSDQDQQPLERWPSMRGGETAVVWDAHLGGYPVCLIGIESHPVSRLGFAPADGPEQWNAGTLFPRSSKKVARAINAASDNRPVVILANLSGFDGSPESMRKLQLEYGAEIGRAVVNFKGPMVFCGISRYHGGAYVVFSQVLNKQLEVVALEGTFASVIGGAPAAAVVFASEAEARTRKDPRMEALSQAMAAADNKEKARLRSQWNDLSKVIHSEKVGELAEEFDSVHSVHRALKVGALHHILPAADLRPYLIDAVARGIAKTDGVMPPLDGTPGTNAGRSKEERSLAAEALVTPAGQ